MAIGPTSATALTKGECDKNQNAANIQFLTLRRAMGSLAGSCSNPSELTNLHKGHGYWRRLQETALPDWRKNLAVVFLAAAIVLLFTLKMAYPTFYSEFRCLLWSTTLVMTLPLTFRALVDLSWHYLNNLWG